MEMPLRCPGALRMSDETQRSRIGRLLAEVQGGSEQARAELFEEVYGDLRTMAGILMVRERGDHTLQPTALVHEAYLRIFIGTPLKSSDRPYFFSAAARAMRRVLVEHARRRHADKRPDGRRREPLDDIHHTVESTQGVGILDLDQALLELEEVNPRQHDVVVLRFFGGLGWKEIAVVLKVSVSTVEKDWQAARAWLYGRLRSDR